MPSLVFSHVPMPFFQAQLNQLKAKAAVDTRNEYSHI